MGLINLGAGLSAMGQSIANTAGTMSLEQQKQDMEAKTLELSNQLVGAREQALETTKETFEGGQEAQRETHEEKIAGMQEASAQKVAGIETGASVANAAAEIAASSKHLGFDDDGNAMIVNTQTGKIAPLVGDDGKPVGMQNPDQQHAITALLSDTKDQLWNTTRQYDGDVKAATDSYREALRTSGNNADDPSVISAQKAIADVKSQYAPRFQELNGRLNGIAGALLNKSKLPMTQDSSGANSRPPLSSFVKVPTAKTPGGVTLSDLTSATTGP